MAMDLMKTLDIKIIAPALRGFLLKLAKLLDKNVFLCYNIILSG